MSSKSKRPHPRAEKAPPPAALTPVPVSFSRRELEWLDRVLAGQAVSGDGVVLCYHLRGKVQFLLRQVAEGERAPSAPAPTDPPAPAEAPSAEPAAAPA